MSDFNPDDWVLVPKKATPEMLSHIWWDGGRSDQWDDILAVAPDAPVALAELVHTALFGDGRMRLLASLGDAPVGYEPDACSLISEDAAEARRQALEEAARCAAAWGKPEILQIIEVVLAPSELCMVHRTAKGIANAIRALADRPAAGGEA